MKLKTTFALFLLVGIFSFVTMSTRCKYCLGPGNGGTTTPSVPDKTLNVWLPAISGLPRPANIRNFPCPATPYLGQGVTNYASSLDDSPFSKFYCVVTVTNLNLSSWGTNGKKTTVWNTANTQKTISVPGSGAYRVTVDYYEQKNNYWTNTALAARGKWTTEQTFVSGYSSTASIGFGPFTFVQQLF